MRWELYLIPTQRIRLDCWPDLFGSPACRVTREENGSYRLAARWLEKIKVEGMTVNEVRESESIKKFITMMTAFAKIELSTYFQGIEPDDEDVTVGIIDYEDDKTIHYVFGKAITSQERVGRATVRQLDKDGNPVSQERWYDYCFSRYNGRINNEVFEALFYFTQITS